MMAKTFLVLCAQIFLVKTVFSQTTCGCGLSNLGLNTLGLSNIVGLSNNNGLSNNLNFGNNVGYNIGAQPALAEVSLASLLASTSPQLLDNLFYGGTLNVASGSSITPSGISVFAENLVADGTVSVTGNVPFLGAVTVEGSLPSGGQGAVVYNSKPGVGLSSGGCGLGLAGSSLASGNLLGGLGGGVVGLGGGNVGLSGGNVGLSGVNVGLGGLNLGGVSFSNGLSSCGYSL